MTKRVEMEALIVAEGELDIRSVTPIFHSTIVYTMAPIQVQVRIPEELVQEIDKWISEGWFASRSDAVKTILSFYQERERTISFYKMLLQRSKEARKLGELIPLDKVDYATRFSCIPRPLNSSRDSP